MVVGQLYLQGQGLPQNHHQAARYFQLVRA
jgi:TPR repeat protein